MFGIFFSSQFFFTSYGVWNVQRLEKKSDIFVLSTPFPTHIPYRPLNPDKNTRNESQEIATGLWFQTVNNQFVLARVLYSGITNTSIQFVQKPNEGENDCLKIVLFFISRSLIRDVFL